MVRILHIKLRRGRPERFLVTLEDESELIFSPETVLKYQFHPEKEFSQEEFRAILKEDSGIRAKDQALRYLEMRPHSEREIRQKLRRKGYSAASIDTAVGRLRRIDLLNDEQFARLFIQNELRLRPCGKQLLRQKLFARGIPRELGDPLLEKYYDEFPEERVARKLADKYLRGKRWEPRKKREKLVRFLQGKGFSWEVIREVVNETNFAATDSDGRS